MNTHSGCFIGNHATFIFAFAALETLLPFPNQPATVLYQKTSIFLVSHSENDASFMQSLSRNRRPTRRYRCSVGFVLSRSKIRAVKRRWSDTFCTCRRAHQTSHSHCMASRSEALKISVSPAPVSVPDPVRGGRSRAASPTKSLVAPSSNTRAGKRGCSFLVIVAFSGPE